MTGKYKKSSQTLFDDITIGISSENRKLLQTSLSVLRGICERRGCIIRMTYRGYADAHRTGRLRRAIKALQRIGFSLQFTA